MQFTTVTGAAVLLALVPTALSLGTARVVNNCGFDVYYASVAQNIAASMVKVPSTGFSEAYSLPNVGISVKIAPTTSESNPTQFEYTWWDDNVSYDISNINGNPFKEWGMTLTPSDEASTAYPTCQTVSCPAGEEVCTAAYNEPNDTKTMVCSANTSLTMTLCPNASGSSSSTTEELVTATEVTPTTTTVAAAATSSTHYGHGHGRTHPRHLPKA